MLAVTEVRISVRGPLLETPPPSPPLAPPPPIPCPPGTPLVLESAPAAPPPLPPLPLALPVITQSITVSVPAFRMPPPDSPGCPGSPELTGAFEPSGARPPVIVRPCRVTVRLTSMSKARSRPAASIFVVAAPAPTIVRLLLMSTSPLRLLLSWAPGMVSLYVPSGTWIVSVPLPAAHSPVAEPDAVSVFAAVTASRSEQCPSVGSSSSSCVLTEIVAAAIPACGNKHATKRTKQVVATQNRGAVAPLAFPVLRPTAPRLSNAPLTGGSESTPEQHR
jgi:hypothetical protein